jgi:hypothetical protein
VQYPQVVNDLARPKGMKLGSNLGYAPRALMLVKSPQDFAANRMVETILKLGVKRLRQLRR